MVDLDSTMINQSNDENSKNILETCENEASWGRLVSLNPEFQHLEIQDDECIFGRNSTCQVQFTDKKISSKHCRVYRKKEEDQVDYRFYIDDYSSNGTFVNRKRVGKGNTVPIVNGNEVSLSSNLEVTDSTRIVYIFQDLDKLRREEKEEKEKNKENEEEGFTLVVDEVPIDNNSMLDNMSPIKKQASTLSSDSNNSSNNSSNTPIKTEVSSLKKATSTTTVSSSLQIDDNNNNRPPKRKLSDISNSVDDETEKKKLNTNDESFDASKTTSATITTPKKQTSTTTGSSVTDTTPVKDTYDNSTTATTPVKITPSKKEIDVEESMGDNLICGICQDIIHKCLTLIPCMHNFCICCYGDWRANSTECPQCRQSVKSAQKNHAINNLIELYLKKNPEKNRDPEELKSMDERCKITDDMLKKGVLNKSKRKYQDDYDEDDDEYNEDDEDEYYSDEEDPIYYPPKCGFCSPSPANPTTGYQCPPTPSPATIYNQTPHLNCANCYKIFPKEPVEPPGIRCGHCQKTYCNLYQACALGGNFGKMKDLPINMIPNDTFGGNQFEIKILSDYLTKNGKTVHQLYLDLINDLDTQKLILPTNLPIGGEPVAEKLRCLGCASSFFSKALFYYRLAIPKEKLPDYAINRDPCYYGRNCRTQFSKFDHAKRLNHICDQTKF